MKPKFFGQFLLEKGIISQKQLVEALAYQQSKIPRLGELAISKRFLTPDQTDKINYEQRRTNKFFGELAVELGFLEKWQLDKLITFQKHNHIYLGETLIEKGFLSEETVEKYLSEFHEEQKPLESLDKLIPDDSPYHEELVGILDITVKLFRRMANLRLKIGKGTIVDEFENKFILAFVEFTGSMNFSYFLNLPRQLGRELAMNLYMREDIEYNDRIVGDFIRELVNIICGNINSQLLELGQNVTIHPPRSIFISDDETYVKPDNSSILQFHARTPNSELSIGIVQQLERDTAAISSNENTINLLIADDSELCRYQLSDIINSMSGITIVGYAKDGSEVLELYDKLKPDAVILDLIMPGVSTEIVLNKLEEKSVKVIVLSGLGNSPGVIEDKYRKGVIAVISKPIETKILKEAILKLLK